MPAWAQVLVMAAIGGLIGGFIVYRMSRRGM
jgi:hypothetical protein